MGKLYKFHGAACTKLHLIHKDPGVKLWWNEAIVALATYPFFVLKLGLDEENSLAYFIKSSEHPNGKLGGWSSEHGISPNICMPASAFKSIKEEDGVTYVEFANDEEVAVFMHEYSHFDHLFVDRGLCHSVLYCGQTFTFDEGSNAELNEPLFAQEYEAGYRSLMYAKKFNMSPDMIQQIKELNIGNLWKFWICRKPEFNTKMAEIMQKKDISLQCYEQQHAYFKAQIIPQIIDKKYREIAFDFDISNNIKLEL